MKKIVFGITDLNIGGAEKVLVDLLKILQDKYQIEIITLYPQGVLEEQIDKEKIEIKNIFNKPYNKYNYIQKKLISLKILLFSKQIYNKYIRNYEARTEIAFLEGPITKIFSTKNKNTKKIAWIHTDISKHLKQSKKSIEKIYNKYKNIVFVSNEILNNFKKYNIETDKKVIYNYIDVERVKDQAKEKIKIKFDENEINIIVVGRLVKAKGIDRLIKVHYKLIKKGYKNRIFVIGDGPLKKILQENIKKLKIEDTFVLLGEIKNPYPYIRQADICLIPSYYEGYGMIAQEAKILNKRILATDTAVKEAMREYI